MSDPVTVAEAARILKRSRSTVRKWITKGAPTVSLGKEGRGNGSTVDVAALQHWRAGGVSADACTNDAELLQKLAAALWDVFKRNATDIDMRAHQALGFADREAAAYLVEVFDRCALNWTGCIPDPPPVNIQTLASLVEQSKPRENERF